MMRPATYSGGMYPLIGQPAYPELWQGCVGAWSMGLGQTGSRVLDWSGLKTHATLTNMDVATDWVMSDGRTALDFDGSNDYCTLGATYQPISTARPFSVTAWVRLNAFSGNNYPCIISLLTNAGHWRLQISNDANYLGLFCGSNNTTWGRFKNSVAATVWPNTWRHVGCVYDGVSPTTASSYSLYVDGIPYTVSSAGPFGLQTIASAIGGDGGAATYMRGMLDDIAVYDNRMISQKEMRLRASRRGIAYELAPYRVSRIFAGGFKAYWATRKAQIIGGGL